MVLRPEFESIRNKVYGIGPREVRLSQDALEMLALIAYRQPVSHQQILESGKEKFDQSRAAVDSSRTGFDRTWRYRSPFSSVLHHSPILEVVRLVGHRRTSSGR